MTFANVIPLGVVTCSSYKRNGRLHLNQACICPLWTINFLILALIGLLNRIGREKSSTTGTESVIDVFSFSYSGLFSLTKHQPKSAGLSAEASTEDTTYPHIPTNQILHINISVDCRVYICTSERIQLQQFPQLSLIQYINRPLLQVNEATLRQ